jgi:hypothetical protein
MAMLRNGVGSNIVKTFQINEYIQMRLTENGVTQICVKQKDEYKGYKIFNQCKYLLLNIPTDKIKEYDNFKSIDDVKDFIDKDASERGDTFKAYVSSTEEFHGHCSNIQAFYENNYDTRILHRNLAFGLLRELAKQGDPLAIKRYKDEIARRINDGNTKTFIYLMANQHFKIFNREELKYIEESIDDQTLKVIFNLSLNKRYEMLDPIEGGNGFYLFTKSAMIIPISELDNPKWKQLKQLEYRKIISLQDLEEYKVILFEKSGVEQLDFPENPYAYYNKIFFDTALEAFGNSDDTLIFIPENDKPIKIANERMGYIVFIAPIIRDSMKVFDKLGAKYIRRYKYMASNPRKADLTQYMEELIKIIDFTTNIEIKNWAFLSNNKDSVRISFQIREDKDFVSPINFNIGELILIKILYNLEEKYENIFFYLRDRNRRFPIKEDAGGKHIIINKMYWIKAIYKKTKRDRGRSYY